MNHEKFAKFAVWSEYENLDRDLWIQVEQVDTASRNLSRVFIAGLNDINTTKLDDKNIMCFF